MLKRSGVFIKWVVMYCIVYNWECEKCPLYRVVGCPPSRVSIVLNIEKQSRLSELSFIHRAVN